MHRCATKLKNIARKLDLQCTSLEARLESAENFSTVSLLKKKVNKTTYNFIVAQIKFHCQHPKGRRYSIDDKVLSLSLYKQSPKGYKALQNIFALPSKKTLIALLSKVPLHCGLNDSLLNSLKSSVDNMKNDLDKYCTIMFDEMSLEASLTYNSRYDRIEGFTDHGENI